MIAAASIITAVDGMLTMTDNKYILKSISSQVLYQLHEITGIEKVCEQFHHIYTLESPPLLRPPSGPGDNWFILPSNTPPVIGYPVSANKWSLSRQSGAALLAFSHRYSLEYQWPRRAICKNAI